MLDMSGKSKKNRAPKAEEPKDDNVPVEEFDDEFVDETEVIEAAPAKGKGKNAPSDSKKKKSKGGFKLSSIDPIILGSFAVFLAACLVVTGVTIYGIVAGDSSNETAEYGDTVLVDYTGSYFAYYDQDGAVIFDTTDEDIANSESYAKSYDFKTKEDYSTVSVKIGNGTYLAAFEDALIGLKPGQEARVTITDGYGSLTDGVDKFTVAKKGSPDYTMARVSTISLSDYQKLFGTTDTPGAGFTKVKSPYGWDVNVTGNSNSTVTIDYGAFVTVGDYTENGVTISVLADPTDVITYEYKIAENFDENAKMLKTVFDGKIVYVIGANDTQFTYKTTDERVGTTMYFVIKLIEFSE